MSLTNQDVINAFRDVFGKEYWLKIIACHLDSLAANRKARYVGPEIDDLPLWGKDRRALATALSAVSAPPPDPKPEPKPILFDWPDGVCLVGLHGRADGRLVSNDYRAIEEAGVEAVKLLSHAAPEDSLVLLGMKQFVLTRLYASFNNRTVSPEDFCSWVVDDARRHYQSGARYFEIHNEPNLRQEGWGRSWANGAEFGRWWISVRDNLASQFPGSKWGWPGLSPDGWSIPDRANDWLFLDAASDATQRADFICLHVYWQSLEEMRGNFYLSQYRARFPDKLLFVSEFSNPSPHVPKAEKGAQYREFYQRLRRIPGVGAAFAFVSSASSGFDHETWVGEDGQLSPIPTAVKSRQF